MQGPVVRRPKPKRYGWHRRYNDDDTNPKWRLVAARASVKLTEVLCVKNHLNDCAARARRKGHVGDFDLHECAVALDIAAEAVAAIFRVLVDMGWLDRSHVIADWPDRQPELEDPTAADRQRNKRARDQALRNAEAGIATPAELELLSKVEREAAARLASLSRVTATPGAEPVPIQMAPFVPIVAKENTHAANEIADGENDRAARRWLLGDGVQLVSYGPAAAILSRNYGCTLMSADVMIRRWLADVLQEAVLLARVISDAHVQGLITDNYQRVVEQRVRALIEERTSGPALPFGFTAQRGGKSA